MSHSYFPTSTAYAIKEVLSLNSSRLASKASAEKTAESASHQDPFQREIRYLRLSITDLCNFRCPYCLPEGYQGKRPSNELSADEIQTIAQAAAAIGIRKIRITGGEPSLRKDLLEIIRTCKQTEGIETVAMTTNGYAIEQAEHWFAAGLDQLNISIDSFDRDTFTQLTGHDCLEKILHHIDQLLAKQHKIQINAVLMHGHPEVFAQALDFVKNRAITVRFIELMQTGQNNQAFFRQHLRAEDRLSQLREQGWQRSMRAAHSGPAQHFSHPDFMGKMGFITPYAQGFCETCNRVRISSQGKLHLCLFDQAAHDLRADLAQGPRFLAEQLTRYLSIKPENHHLHEQNSGIMPHLAMIGG